jgi:5-methylthioadenosine/S-adenosylhomocysteine deaminase
MRFVARAYPAIAPHDVLRMGTLEGAEALGRDDEVGSLTTGKLANIVAVPLDETSAGGPDDALESLFSTNLPVSGVWVRGARCKMGAA